uniref:Reverse transcriptase zinc-binding domain-containing protein n=1 Tax=Tanacetum cinerariifolium TaxID=118510 RepID=A0A6L2K107_TANCI|nr:reverse transcriptase zinc-binding domain-containing protein [Tanacetum cinerariifolium]
MKKRLKTQDVLSSWEVSGDLAIVCPLCETQPDSHEHLFFDCPFSQQVWSRVKRVTGLLRSGSSLDSIISILLPIAKRKSSKSCIGKLVFAAAAYYVWQERNFRLFKNSKSSIQEVVDCIMSSVRLKLLSCRFKKSKDVVMFAWLWELPMSMLKLSHLNFGTINDLTKHDLVDGLSKFKYEKDHICSACERGKSKKSSHPPKLVLSTHSKLELLHMDLCRPMRVASINGKKKPNVEYFHMFGSLCYPTSDRDDLGKMKPKANISIFIGYSKTSRGFQIYNRRAKKIMETIHVKFDDLTAMASEHDSSEPTFQRFINDLSPDSMNTPSKEVLDNLFGPIYDEYFEKKSSDMPIHSAARQDHNHKD